MEAFGEAVGRAVAATIDYTKNNSVRALAEIEKTFGQLAVAFDRTFERGDGDGTESG